IDLFLHGLAPRLGPLASFDLLPIPYRAVATDLETGQPVVLDHGDLSQAMRASMSVPGVFAPLEVDGRLLADGGLVRNLPVDVARALGADVIIAVDVGAPLRNRHQLQSVLDVSQQVLNILTGQNVRESLQQLGPGDVLVLPELAGIGAGDFDDIDRIIASGEAAARAVSDGWRELALDPAEYARWRAQLRAREAEPERIDAVRVDAAGLKHVNPEAVEARLRARPDPTFDPGRLLDDVQSIYAMDDFERVSWRVDEEGGQRVLVVVPEEKEWGPDYLQFGVNLATDLSGSSSFSVLLAERSTWLNRAGLEWRNEVSVGRTTGLRSELYQPLAAGSRWFVAPSFHLSQQRDDLYEGDSPVATYRVRSAAFDLDLGRRLSDTASLRVGLERGSTRAVPGVAVPGFPDRSDAIGVWQLKLSDDRFDAWAFPASGEYGFAQLRVARLGLGSGSDYERAEVGEDLALSIGPWRGVIGARGGRSRGGTLPFDEYFPLGGFLNLSGYNPREFLGTRYALGRILLSRRTELIGLKNGYLGASLEAGSVGERLNGPATGILPSATAFIGLDTPLGPTAFGLGMGKASHFAVYVFLGRP
ncbi:MAG TPA: patatin-like phospholipase family protein, partial [Burkholderiaceae bacterium]